MSTFKNCLGWLLSACLAATLTACGGNDRPKASAQAVNGSAATASASASAAASPDKRILSHTATAFAGNGWYWNAAESGTGFMFEAQDNRAFVGFFMYENGTGNPIWYVSYGNIVSGAAAGEFKFTGDLGVTSGGKPVASSTYMGPNPSFNVVGPVSIDFAGGKATVAFPGGRTMVAERFPIDGSGVDFSKPVPQRSNQPETGWYWNPAEGGRGYAIEVQNDKVFMAVFHYNLDGSPTWNLMEGDISTGTAVERFQLTTGGQTLTSVFKVSGVRDFMGPFTMNFRNACTGQMQLFGAPPITVRRFTIDGTIQPPGSECRALASLADVPDIGSGAADMAPGDSIYGKIDFGGDADGYRITLAAGSTYTFELLGAASKSGTLENPKLGLYDADLVQLKENDNRDANSNESRITWTATRTGAYFLKAQASAPTGVGSFLLISSGVGPGINVQVSRPLSSFAGTVAGTLRGIDPGKIDLQIFPDGVVNGSARFDSAPNSVVGFVGSVGPDGLVTPSATSQIQCNGFVSGKNFLGSCGAKGMITGVFSPTDAQTAFISGTVIGLADGSQVSLANNAETVVVAGSAAGGSTPFVFPTSVANGGIYKVTVATQPTGAPQLCSVSNGLGTVAGNVASIVVNCVSSARSVGGTVSGLAAGASVVLKSTCPPNQFCSNGGPEQTITANGAFSFSGFGTGSPYSVFVWTQPKNPVQVCTVNNGTGTVSGNVTDIAVNCVTPATATVSATVAGLAGSGLVLQINGAERLAVAGDGTARFFSTVSAGGAYDVKVLAQPTNPYQVCSVTNGSGSASGNVSNIAVSCVRHFPRFVYSASFLAPGLSTHLLDVSTGRQRLVDHINNGTQPFSVTLDPTGKFAYTANVGDNISQYAVGTNGKLTPLVPATVAAGKQPLSVTVDPSGRFAYVANSLANSISQFKIEASGTLTPLSPATAATGDIPFAVTVDPSGQRVYVINWTSNDISQFNITANGTLQPMASPTIAAGVAQPRFITIDRIGRFAYISNIDSVTKHFAIAADGSLSAVGTIPGGAFTLSPSGKNAYAVETAANRVLQYAVDSATGSVTALGTARVAIPTTAPQRIGIDPSGNFAYVVAGDDTTVGARASRVEQFLIAADGQLIPNGVLAGRAVDGVAFSHGTAAANPVPLFAYAANASGNNITQYSIGASGGLAPLTPSSVATGLRPVSVKVDPTSRFAYAVNANENTVSQYKIDASGRLVPMTVARVAAGTGPLDVAIGPSGKYAYVAASGCNSDNSCPGTAKVFQFEVNPVDGSLSPLKTVSGTAIPTAEISTGALQDRRLRIKIDPSGRFAYVMTGDRLTGDRIMQYAVAATGALIPMSTSSVTVPGLNPSDIEINSSGSAAFVPFFGTFSGDGGVAQFSINSADGALSRQSVPFVGSFGATTIALDPLDRFAYTAVFDGAVEQFKFEISGGLSKLFPGAVEAGTNPWGIAVDLSGKFVYVTNANGGDISQYAIGANGALAPMNPARVGGGTGSLSITTTGTWR